MKTMVKRVRHPLRFFKALSRSSKGRRGKSQEVQSKFVEDNGSVTDSENTVFDIRPEDGVLKDEKGLKTAGGGDLVQERVETPVPVVEPLSDGAGAEVAEETGQDSGEQAEADVGGHEGEAMEAGRENMEVDEQDVGGPSHGPHMDAATEPEDLLPEFETEQPGKGSMADDARTGCLSSPPIDLASSPAQTTELIAYTALDDHAEPFGSMADSEPDGAHTPLSVAVQDIAEQPVVPSIEHIDPFLVDDPDDPDADELQTPRPLDASHSRAPSLLASWPTDFPETPFTPKPESQPPSETARPPLNVVTGAPLSPNVSKDEPPTPQLPGADSDSDDEGMPEIYLPSLTMPTMFLPIPNTDPLTTLLTKHIPESHLRPTRDITGDWQHTDFHTLVMTNNWRALARMARDRLVLSKPSDIVSILSLWYLRLSSLARLRFFNQTSAECTNLFSVLNGVEPLTLRTYIFEGVLPFELDVLRARCLYWSGDHMGYLDECSALLFRCRSKASKARSATDKAMWKERGARICLIIASQLIEMKDFMAATSLLEGLCDHNAKGTDSLFSSPALRSAIARIYLQSGYVAKAAQHMSIVERDPDADESIKDMNAILLAIANGDWGKAADAARKLLKKDGSDTAAINNLAVALLSQGKLAEGIETLEGALQNSPAAVSVAEPFLFNLSTLYELRAGLTAHKKRNLLMDVARWSGDGLKTTCLKMSAA